MPAAFISLIRSVTSSSCTGSAYICCMRAVAFSAGSSRISSNSGVGILVAGPQSFEIEDSQAPQPPDLDGRGRADHAVHGRGQQREIELVGVDLPADIDVLGVAGPPAGHDGDVVEPVGPPTRFEDANLKLSHVLCPPDPVRSSPHLRPAAAPTVSRPTAPHDTAWDRRAGPSPGPVPPPSAAHPPPRSHRPRPPGRTPPSTRGGHRAPRHLRSARRGGGPEGGGNATPRTRQSSSINVRAVAPHTVSPATSKNHTGNSPSGMPETPTRPGTDHHSSWKTPSATSSLRATSKIRSTSEGLAARDGAPIERGHHRGHHRVGGHRGHRGEHGRSPWPARHRGRPLRPPHGGRPPPPPRRAPTSRRGTPPPPGGTGGGRRGR